jgi:thiamine biosynthesis lipoprotein
MSPLSSWLLAGAAVLPVAAPAVVHAEPFRFHFDHVLGTSLDVVALAPDETTALMAVTAAKHEISRLDRVLSDWRADSQLSALNRGEAIAASPDLTKVLALCEQWRGRTDGAFDCRTGAALRLWRDAAASSGAVQPAIPHRALSAAGQPLARVSDTTSLQLPEGARLTVDGLAKGYVIDAAMAAARRASPSLSGLMIDIGGDLRCWGQSPEQGGWRIGVADAHSPDNVDPPHLLHLSNRALAASGRGARDLEVDGCAVSHTLSPGSGQPVSQVRSAVVVAHSAADADALSTAFMVMAPERALALANGLDGVEAYITDRQGGRHVSDGWTEFAGGEPRLIRTAAPAGPAASKGIGLDLTYTVPKIDAEPYHAPYVVMWVTDENRRMVRTLLVLGAKPKWAPENFIWWRRYGRLTPQVLDTVGRATRPPGRYSVHWDGMDDSGAAVRPGRYIVHVEASREKGGHTYQTVDLDVSGRGTKVLPAKDEMGALELKFGPGA